MVLESRDEVARRLDLAQVDGDVVEGDAARLLEQVLHVHIAQVVAVHRVRHARRIAVPEQQVERERVLAHQVVVHHEGPDQVVRAQHVEGAGHLGAFQEAALGHLLFEAGHLLLVDEDAQLAGDREVEHGGEEGRRGDALVLLRRHVGECGAEQRPAQAVARGVDFLLAGLLADLVHRGQRRFGQVVLEGLLGEMGIGVDPRHHEDGVALVGGPLDVGVLLAQVEDVVLVDPGREDQQRPLEHFLGGRFELQELDQVVLEHHLARRGGDVLAEFEGVGVGHLDAQLAVAFLDVAQQVVEALEQVLAVRLDGLAEDLGVGHGEIRRRERIDELAGEEVDLLLAVLVQTVDATNRVVDVAGGDQVGLLDEVEQEMVFPLLVLEALVVLGRLRDGRSVHAHHAQ